MSRPGIEPGTSRSRSVDGIVMLSAEKGICPYFIELIPSPFCMQSIHQFQSQIKLIFLRIDTPVFSIVSLQLSPSFLVMDMILPFFSLLFDVTQLKHFGKFVSSTVEAYANDLNTAGCYLLVQNDFKGQKYKRQLNKQLYKQSLKCQ